MKSASLEDAAWDRSFISWLFLMYLQPVFRQGVGGNLAYQDLGGVCEQDATVHLANDFSHEWASEMTKPRGKRKLWSVIWRALGTRRLYIAFALYAFSFCAAYVPVFVLNLLVRHFEGIIELSVVSLYLLCVALLVATIASSLALTHSNIIVGHIGAQIRNALTLAIYRKACRIPSSARIRPSQEDIQKGKTEMKTLTSGQIVNMFSQDTRTLGQFMMFINNAVMAPVEIVVALLLLYFQVDWSAFIGFSMLLCTIPLSQQVIGYVNTVRRKKMGSGDTRVKLMNEILGGIRILKYYAWEKPFQAKILSVRERELKYMRKMAYLLNCGVQLIMFSVPKAQPIIVFWFYTSVLNQELDAATAFTALSYFSMMQRPIFFLPQGLATYSQSLVSCGRILAFLDIDELKNYVTHHPASDHGRGFVSMRNAVLSWEQSESPDLGSNLDSNKDQAQALVESGQGNGGGGETYPFGYQF